MEYNEILENLKEERKKKNVSRRKLAEIIGKSENFIFHVESGKTDLKLKDYLKICDALEIPPQELLNSKYSREFYNTTAEQLENLSNRDFLLVKNLIALMNGP